MFRSFRIRMMFRISLTAETLYGQGGEVHVHPANAAAILFRTVNRVNEFHT